MVSSIEMAERFMNIAMSQNIESEYRPGEDQNNWEIWILSESDIEEGRELLSDFKKDPNSQDYIKKAALGIALKNQKEKEEMILEKKQKKIKKKLGYAQVGWGHTVLSLILLCVFLHLLSQQFGDLILSFMSYSQYSGHEFIEIKNGQIWRVFTPMLLHANWLHLIFNMLWLYQLGGMIERDKGGWYTLKLVLIFSAAANTAQYIVSGGNFLGMSGVVYGLFGFVWMKSQFESNINYFLTNFTIGFLLTIYILFSIGFLGGGRIANTNHGVGLCAGMIYGFLSTDYLQSISSIKKLTFQEILIGLLPFALAAIGIVADLY